MGVQVAKWLARRALTNAAWIFIATASGTFNAVSSISCMPFVKCISGHVRWNLQYIN